MNNPLPVDPFSVAEAARRTWPALIEAMLAVARPCRSCAG